MSREKRRMKVEAELADLEKEFTLKLDAALADCAAGAWGLFERKAEPDGYEHKSAGFIAARELLRLGDLISGLRGDLGMSEEFRPLARFVHYRAKQDANDPGEPKLAKLLRDELKAR